MGEVIMEEKRKLLLIIEDHQTTQRILTRVLEYNGWDVEAASTVSQGLELLNTKPHCVVLDLMLPDGNGEDVLRRAKEVNPQIRVVVTSATGDEKRLEALRELKPDAIIPKPIEMNTLLNACSASPTSQ
ncbi:MAG TPA: response regulator [Isosphaeraceae bacterium]|jgi:two-component system NtrC family response regulator|nr:response regulator [Isosphaeraceae bacterium]